jgi:hypothetical protein
MGVLLYVKIDFVMKYSELYVCRFFDKAHWPFQSIIQGHWNSITAGGCTNYWSVAESPQYLLTTREDTSIVISVSQDADAHTRLFAIAIEVFDNEGNRVTRKRRGQQVAGSVGGHRCRREVVAQVVLIFISLTSHKSEFRLLLCNV